MAYRTEAFSRIVKWVSVTTCTAGAFASASLLFQDSYVGDFLLHLLLSVWLILMGLADFSLEPADTLTTKCICETGKDPKKRGIYMIIISLMLPCYTNWTQLTSSDTVSFVLTKIFWVILLVGGILVTVLGIITHFCA